MQGGRLLGSKTALCSGNRNQRKAREVCLLENSSLRRGGGVPDAWAGGCSLVFRIPWPDGLCGHAGPQEQGAREGHTALDIRGLFTSLPAWHHSRASVPTASAPAGPVSAGSSGEACWGTGLLAGMARLAAGPLVVLDGREQQVWDFCALGSPSFVLASSWALSEALRIERRMMVIP